MSKIVRKDTDSDGVEVNIMYAFGLLLRRLWLLILVALVVGASCAVITKAVEEPTYTLSMTFIVNNKSEKDLSSSGENSVSYNDMSASAYMANTFVHLMTGRTMCNAIAAECKSYPKTADQVAKMIAASRKTDSSIIDMTVTASSPEEAYELAQAVKDTYKDVVQVYSGGSIHLCDEPELPTKPDKSVGTVRNAIIGALAGAVICALIIIIRDSARNTVRSQEDIQNKLQLNVIGEVSQVPSGERFYKKSAHGDRELLITDKACGFAFVETYKAMRTKLELLNGRRGYKSFVVSSAGANEGKTTVAVNLSLALAQNGYSVLLVDADLRKPSVLKNLGISNLSGNGIADVVNGAKNSSDAIKYIEKYKIFVLAGDESITDPTEVLSNAKTGEFIAAAREKFDYIIIDTPPVGIVADAAICAKYTDSSIFVIREDVFPVPAILEAVSDLTQGGTDLAGCVYNISTDRSKGGYGNYSISSRRYGYGYGYGKHYGYGYGYGSHSGSHGKTANKQNISAFGSFANRRLIFIFSVLPAGTSVSLNHPRSFGIVLRISPRVGAGCRAYLSGAHIGQACLRLFFAAQRSCLNTSYHRRIEVKQLARDFERVLLRGLLGLVGREPFVLEFFNALVERSSVEVLALVIAALCGRECAFALLEVDRHLLEERIPARQIESLYHAAPFFPCVVIELRGARGTPEGQHIKLVELEILPVLVGAGIGVSLSDMLAERQFGARHEQPVNIFEQAHECVDTLSKRLIFLLSNALMLRL